MAASATSGWRVLRRALACLPLLLLLAAGPASAALPVPLSAGAFQFRSLAIGGEIEYETEYRDSDGESTLREFLDIDTEAVARGFYWQPWFATWTLGTRVNLVFGDPLYGDAGTRDFSLLGVQAGADLFPRSRFPFKVGFSHDEVQRGALVVGGERDTRTNFSLTGNYTPAPGQRYRGDFRHYFETREGRENLLRDRLQLSADYAIGKTQSLQADFEYDREESDSSLDQTAVFLVDHEFLPHANVTSQSLLNLSYDSDQNDSGITSELQLLQLTNSLFWRPEDPRLTVTGNTLLSYTDSTVSGTASGDSREALIVQETVTANFEYSRSVGFFGSAFLGYQDENDDADWRSLLVAGSRYTGASREWRGATHNWGASMQLLNSTDTGGDDEFLAGAGASESLGKTWVLGAFAFVLGHSAEFENSHSSLDGVLAEFDLQHDATVSWGRSAARHSQSVTLNLSDDRSYVLVDDEGDEEDDEAQVVTLSASHAHTLSRTADYRVDYRLTAGRETGEASRGDTLSSSFSASFQDRNLFGIPRTRMVSALRLDAEDLVLDFGSGEDQRMSFENDFFYLIGRLLLELETEFRRDEGRNDIRVMFRATRAFGRR